MKHEILIAQAMRVLLNECPMYYFIMAPISKVVLPEADFPAAVGYNKKTGEITLLLSEKYLDHMNVNDLATLLEHECNHLALSHLMMAHKNLYQGIPHNIVNMAQDYIINDHIPAIYNHYDSLMQRRNTAMEEMNILAKQVSETSTKEEKAEIHDKIELVRRKNFLSLGCLKPNLEKIEELKGKDLRQMDSLTLARILFENSKQNGGNQDKSEIYDDHDIEDGSDSENGQSGNEKTQGLSKVPQNAIDRMLQEAAKEVLQRVNGNIPAHLEQRLNDLKRSRMEVGKVIRLFSQSVVSSKTTPSWGRQNKRYPGQTPGKDVQTFAKIVVWVDTSGSVWEEGIQKEMAGHIKALTMACPHVEVVFGDTEISHKVVVKNNFKLSNLIFRGGGGTSPQFVFDYAKKIKANGVVLLTDGAVSQFDSFNIKTLVGLVGPQTQEIPGYKNIPMKVTA